MNPSSSTSILPSTTTYLLRQMLLASNRSQTINLKIVKQLGLVKSISARLGIPIPALGVAPLFEDVQLIKRTRPNWALYNVYHDPLWKTGYFPIPRADLRRLHRLYRNGIEFDALYVAHELPLDFNPVTDHLELSLIKPAPPEASTQLARNFGAVSDAVVATYAAVLRKPVHALAAAGKSRTALLTDPILMGAIVPPGTNPEPGVQAVWFLLAAWRW